MYAKSLLKPILMNSVLAWMHRLVIAAPYLNCLEIGYCDFIYLFIYLFIFDSVYVAPEDNTIVIAMAVTFGIFGAVMTVVGFLVLYFKVSFSRLTSVGMPKFFSMAGSTRVPSAFAGCQMEVLDKD